MPQHTIHIYQRPAQGNGFVQSHVAYNYKHKIAAQGGFDTMSCSLQLRSRADGEVFLQDHIGARVAAFVDNPQAPIWEGLINRITLNTGGGSYSISMDEMINRVDVALSASGSVAGSLTGVTNNTASQAIYGIKHGVLDIGVYVAAGGGTYATDIRNMALLSAAYPKTSWTQSNSTGNIIELECIGFYHTLRWQPFVAATAGTTYYAQLTTYMLPALANGTTFFNNADFTLISANAQSRTRIETGNLSYWDVLLKQAGAGDGTSPWVVGVSPTRRDGTRALYYRAFNSTVEYTASITDQLRIRDILGRSVRPWTVQPDRGIRINDALIGWAFAGDDPRETYIETIDYDGETGRVIWTGADDTTTEGAFQLRRITKTTSSRFGSTRRMVG